MASIWLFPDCEVLVLTRREIEPVLYQAPHVLGAHGISMIHTIAP